MLMSQHARERFLWVAAIVVVAALVHMGSLYMVPRIVMAQALAAMGAPNTMHYPKRSDAAARAIVMPSPDLLYSTCPFDLSKGPLRVNARVPHSTYWSVSAFDVATNNFFVRNDRQIAGNSIEILLVRPGMAWPALDDAVERIILFAPADKGLILFRLLIDDDKHLSALDAIRRHSNCATVHPVATAHGLR